MDMQILYNNPSRRDKRRSSLMKRLSKPSRFSQKFGMKRNPDSSPMKSVSNRAKMLADKLKEKNKVFSSSKNSKKSVIDQLEDLRNPKQGEKMKGKKKASKKKASPKKVSKKKASTKKKTKKKSSAKKVAKKKSSAKKVSPKKKKTTKKSGKKKVAKKASIKKKKAKKSRRTRRISKKKAAVLEVKPTFPTYENPKKKKVRKSRKKKGSKKKSSKRKSSKKKSSKKKSSKKLSFKKPKAMKAKSRKSKKNPSYKKKFSLKTNPIGGAMKKVEQFSKNVLAHDLGEAGGLLAGGAAIQGIRHLQAKFAPQLSSTLAKIPMIGNFLASNLDSIIPLAVGAVAHKYVKNSKVKALAKGVIGASVVGIGSKIYVSAAKMAGAQLSGIIAVPSMNGIIAVPQMGAMKMVDDFGAAPASISSSDFGAYGVGLSGEGGYLQSADFDSAGPRMTAARQPDSLNGFEVDDFSGESDF